MHLHDESSEVLLPRTNDPSIQLACAGCGKTGVSICAKCAKTGYRKAVARANPLQKRDPELYGRLDKMSQLSLREIKPLWDEFCIEINAEDFYEHLPIFVEILQEGKWRTDALNVRKWLHGNLAKRVKRLCGPDDYGPAVASVDEHGRPVISRTRRPSWPKFDKRNGAVIAVGTQPYTEFEVQDDDGDAMTSEEAVDYLAGQTTQDQDGNPIRVMPADADSLKIFGHRTCADQSEAYRCEHMADALKNDRAVFETALTEAIVAQRGLVERMELDQDEAVVLAVIELLSSVGPRMYLNFLDGPDKKRIRNAWDRLDRKRKNPDWSARFRRTLRTCANETRAAWSRKYWAEYYLDMDRHDWRRLIPPDAVRIEDFKERNDSPRPKWDSSRGLGIPSEQVLRHHTQLDRSQGLIFPPSKETPPNLDAHDGARLVELGWDLTPKQRALFLSSASKPKPRRKTRLYSE